MIRMSSIARRLQCPQFGNTTVPPGTTPITISAGDSLPAREGSAAHEAMSFYIETGRYPDVRKIADKFKIPDSDRDNLIAGINFAIKTWDEDLSQYFPNPRTEIEVVSETLSALLGDKVIGHADVISILPEKCGAVLDWKFGRGDSDYWGNMMAYGLATCEQFDLDFITLSVVHLRLNTIDTQRFHRTELEAWAADSVRPRLIDEASHYNPSAACTYCDRKTDCPARRAVIQSTADTLLSITGDDSPGRSMFPDLYDPALRPHSGDKVVALLDRIKLITDAVDTVKEELKQNLRDFGPIDIGNGRVYGIGKRVTKKLEPTIALDALRQFGATDRELCDSMRISYSTIEGLLAKRATKEQGRGAGKKTREALFSHMKATEGAMELQESEVAQRMRADAAQLT